jgi:hypothetical protein
MGSAIFCTFCISKVVVKKSKNGTFVRFSDYYLNIPLWATAFKFHYIDIAMPEIVYL